jgi:parallel beta-helix repeat protein
MIKAQIRVLLLLITILLSLIAGIFPIENCIASGNTIYVDDSGGENYTSIQTAIDAANNGDTIYVYSGTYNENVEITKDLILTGQNKDTTIIDGGKNSYVVYAYGTLGNEIEIHISGFTVRNAGGTGNDCIALSYVNNGSINNNKILNSDKSDGIQLDHCSAITINDNQITGNTAAGISLTRSENSIIYNNAIQNNQKGIYIYDSSSSNNAYSNTITGNSQYGVHIQISYYQSQNNIFYQNDFTNNGQNAQDPYSNYWNYNSQGNYWDNYNDYDSDENGIGDAPYDIPGGSNQDEYPLGYFLEPEHQQPTAYQPTIYPNPATYGNTVSFSGSGSDSDGYIADYNWRSSIDGQLSTNNEFSMSSLSIGTHIIYFKVQDNEGTWSSEQTASLTINPPENQDPAAFIDSVTPNPAEYMMMISFCGHGTDEDGYITGWKWTSSIDGAIGNEEAFNISDLSIGTHTIYFQVRDNASEWSEQVTESLIISLNPLNQPPIANAGGPCSGNMNDEIIFDGSASYDEDGEIIEYLWDFGDGTNGFGKSITHTYTSPGNYTITLIVTDDDKDISTDTNIATVVQSSGQNSGNAGATGFEFELPIPLVLIIEAAFVVVGILTFLFWIKRK